MNKEELYYLGYVSAKHGLGNSLVIKMDVDNTNDYTDIDGVFVELNKSMLPIFVSKSRPFKSKEIIIEVEDVADVKSFVGCSVYLPINLLPKLDGKKFYFHEIIGYSVHDTTKGPIGVISEVLDYPHQQLFSIKHNFKEILIPIVDEFIIDVNRNKKTIVISAPEGLIDIYLNESKSQEEE